MAYNQPTLQQGTSPSHYQGVSAEVILLGSDLLKDNPQLLTQYFKTYNLKPTFLHKLRTLGFSRRVEGPTTGHYEDPRPTHTFKTGTVVTPAGGPGQVIVVSLDPSAMYSFVDSTGTTIRGSRPRRGETIMFADRNEYRIESKDETQNPHRLTIKPGKSTVNANTAITPGATAFIVGTIKGEATGQVQPLTPRYMKYENTFAIIDETDIQSGTFLTTGSSFEPVEGKPGYFWLKGLEDAEVRHERSKSNRAIFGQTYDNLQDNSTTLGRNVNISGTEGLIQFAQTNGFEDTYANLSAYVIDDFYAAAGYYEERRIASNEISVMQGYKLGNKVEQILKDFLDNTYVDYVGKTYMGAAMAESGLSANDMFVTVGFKGLNVGGFNFLFMKLDELNDTEGAGNAAFNYNQWQIMTPMGFFKNKKANEMLPLMGYEYRGNSMGYSRENETWKTGGAGPIQKTSEFDAQNCYFRSEIATHFALGNQFLIQRPV